MKTKKNKIKKNKTKKNKSIKNKKKNKIGGAENNSTSKCSYYPNIEKNQQHELLTQEIDQRIIESIERVKRIQPDILHIIIGGNCTPGNEYYNDCINSREVTRNYSGNYFVINIDPESSTGSSPERSPERSPGSSPRSSPERSPGTEDRFLNLNYFHSKEVDCTYNLKLRELIIDILTRNTNAIVLIDNQIFLYREPDGGDEMINYLEPFAKIDNIEESFSSSVGGLKMSSKQPSLNEDFFGELNKHQQNRIIFSSYLKSRSDLICPGKSGGKLRGKTTFMKYYYYLCELCGKEPLKVKELKQKTILLEYPNVLKLLIETKLKDIGRHFDSGITC